MNDAARAATVGRTERVPAEVLLLCRDWLDQVHRLAPGLVTGLHLRGGIGFGEYVGGKSDVDFVAVLAHRPSPAELDALEDAHLAVAELHQELFFDGAHLLASDLAADPQLCPDVPCTLHRIFEPEARRDISPVTWHELAHHGVTVHGTDLSALQVWTSQQALLDFTRDNLDTYWRGHAEALPAFPSEAATEASCEWCVPGVARLHHLLVTGEQTSKSAALRWGLEFYPSRFHLVLAEALRIREDPGACSAYLDPLERGRDVAAFTAYVVTAGTA
ncbi:MAG TPA: aminoglycoside adenylyltransferase domain-containing protein [Nocardioides sp.]